MSETIHFETGDAKVTESLAVIGGQTFALANIGSVVVQEHGKNLIGPIIFGLVGIGCLAGGSDWSVLYLAGLASLAVAAYVWRSNRASWHLVLESGGRKIDAFQSTDRAAVIALRDALTAGMARRA
jgi:hypothetical protein